MKPDLGLNLGVNPPPPPGPAVKPDLGLDLSVNAPPPLLTPPCFEA